MDGNAWKRRGNGWQPQENPICSQIDVGVPDTDLTIKGFLLGLPAVCTPFPGVSVNGMFWNVPGAQRVPEE